MEPVIGIDLGTTNSEVAFVFDGQATVIRDDENPNGIVPSCVGLSDEGRVIVGRQALNQALYAPDRTVLSIKRLMGTDRKVLLGDEEFVPQEISAFILKSLRELAERRMGAQVKKAVITVPAYFTDAQRQATREAGEIAGLDVVRIINEPTAAALAYESQQPDTRRVLIYDLGGGTFDVSVVKIEDAVVEVLATTGNNHLGGDDLDRKIVAHLLKHIETQLQFKVDEDPLILARLKRAAEKAKIDLSIQPYTLIEEDHIGQQDGRDLHLALEIARLDFENMIEPEIANTMQLVDQSLRDARLSADDIDKVILVGGSTRIPQIPLLLEKKFGKQPYGHIDPDLCVAMGAGIQAAREMGVDNSGVLVDITPYTFGTSAVGEVDGLPSTTMFVPLIRRNSKLPARKSEVFYTMYDRQKAVEVLVHQGEQNDASDNILLGNYLFHLTPAPAGSEIILDFDLDLNGVLKIRAIEKSSGKHIDATIENAISRFSDRELSLTRDRLDGLWKSRISTKAIDRPPGRDEDEADVPTAFAEIIRRAERLLPTAVPEDRQEVAGLIEDIRKALEDGLWEQAETLRQQLDDLLFYMEE